MHSLLPQKKPSPWNGANVDAQSQPLLLNSLHCKIRRAFSQPTIKNGRVKQRNTTGTISPLNPRHIYLFLFPYCFFLMSRLERSRVLCGCSQVSTASNLKLAQMTFSASSSLVFHPQNCRAAHTVGLTSG